MSGLDEDKKQAVAVNDSAFLIDIECRLNNWEKSVRDAEVGKKDSASWDYWYVNDAILKERYDQIKRLREAVDDSRLAQNEAYAKNAYHDVVATTKQWYLKNGLESIGKLVAQHHRGEYPPDPWGKRRPGDISYRDSVAALIVERDSLREQLGKARNEGDSLRKELSKLGRERHRMRMRLQALEEELEKLRKGNPHSHSDKKEERGQSGESRSSSGGAKHTFSSPIHHRSVFIPGVSQQDILEDEAARQALQVQAYKPGGVK